MMKRPTGRTRYYSKGVSGVKRQEQTVLQSLQKPPKPQKDVNPREVAQYVRKMGEPNRNAPLQKLRPTYYRKIKR